MLVQVHQNLIQLRSARKKVSGRSAGDVRQAAATLGASEVIEAGTRGSDCPAAKRTAIPTRSGHVILSLNRSF
jgi:hypothetical protein